VDGSGVEPGYSIHCRESNYSSASASSGTRKYHARIKFGPHRVWLARAFESLVKCLKGRTPISLIAVCLTAKQKSGVLSMSMLIEFVIEIYCTVGLVRHDTHEKPVPRGPRYTFLAGPGCRLAFTPYDDMTP
jgi:hypothetical protein